MDKNDLNVNDPRALRIKLEREKYYSQQERHQQFTCCTAPTFKNFNKEHGKLFEYRS